MSDYQNSRELARFKSALNRFKNKISQKILRSKKNKIDAIFFEEILNEDEASSSELIKNIRNFENSKIMQSTLSKIFFRGRAKRSVRKIWNWFD